MLYHFGVDALCDELQNHKIWRCWIWQATTTYTITLFIYYITFFQIRKCIPLTIEDLQYAGITPLQACIRTTEKHDYSVEDDLFDLGLRCQVGYYG